MSLPDAARPLEYDAIERYVPAGLAPSGLAYITNTSALGAAPVAVGEAFHIAPLRISNLRFAESLAGGRVHIMCDSPAGFFVDAHTGAVLAYPTRAGNYTVTQYLLDVQSRKLMLTDTFNVDIRRKDTDDPGNGPNGFGCAHGDALDGVGRERFDHAFTCNCTGTIYTGDNCAMVAYQRAVEQSRERGLPS